MSPKWVLAVVIFANTVSLTSGTLSFASIGLLFGIVATPTTGLYGADWAICRYKECCDENWISANFTDLHLTLQRKVHGQHLASGQLIKLLKGHSKNPSKALALSFHGPTGTGKSFVSRLMAANMYFEGMKSNYVHVISAVIDFPHAEAELPSYKKKMRDKIETAIGACERSLFIFDEMDKMPNGLIDTITPYLDQYDILNGVDYRKATFIFLSNTGGHAIVEKTIAHWKDNQERETLQRSVMEDLVHLPVLNSEGGLWHSELITKHLISAYIIFLPMERKHVKLCIKDGLISKGYYNSTEEISDAKVQEIADELTYFPDDIQVFSTTGCKRINDRILLIMEEA